MDDLFGNPIESPSTLQEAVDQSIKILRMYNREEPYVLADSGGKDSTVLLALAKMADVRFEPSYNMTTIDPPELIYFLRKHHPETIWNRPAKPLLKRLIEKGFPLRTKRWCCQEYKECYGKGRRILLGVRKEESRNRGKREMVERCFRDPSKEYVNPIIYWTEKQVWEFIRAEKLPYCSLYDEGFKRIGCIMCTYNYSRQIEAKRWPRFKALFEKAFCELYEKNKTRIAYRRWRDGIEMFDWWLAKKPTPKNQQTIIFG